MTFHSVTDEARHRSPAFARGAVLAATSRVGVAIAGALTTILLARLLGPGAWGSFAVAQALAAILLSASTLGVEHGIIYFVSSRNWSPRAAFTVAMKVAAGVGVVGASTGVVVRLFAPSAFPGLSVPLSTLVAFTLPFALGWYYTSVVALATERYEAAMLMPALQAALVLALALPGELFAGATGAIVGAMMATAIVGIAAPLWGTRQFSAAGEPSSLVGLREAVAFGVKGYAGNAMQMINYRLDLFILASVATTASVGHYSLAVAVTSLLWLVPNAISDVLFPRVARLSNDGRNGSSGRLFVEAKSIRHTSLILIVSSAALATALPLLVTPIFGKAFHHSIVLGLILLPGAAAIALSSVLAAIVVGRGKASYSMYVALVTTPLTIVMYAVLIPAWQATGAAIASTSSYCLSLLLWCWFHARLTGRQVFPLLVPTRSEIDDLQALALSTLRNLRGPQHAVEQAPDT